MKVAFVARKTLYSTPGGDTKQIEATALGLRQQGVTVDIFLAHQKPDYRDYDLLHFFNIIRPADILRHTSIAKTPYLVSTIYVKYGAIDGNQAGRLRQIISSIISEDGMEYLKALGRWVFNREFPGSWRYLIRGHKNAIKQVARRAAMLLPNSESEYRVFSTDYNLECPYRIIPNGVDKAAVTEHYQTADNYRNAIICMARIEPLKNQLGLIRALNKTGIRVFIHGKASPNHHQYYNQCQHEAAENIQILPWLETSQLYPIYATARVHVLPSFFETTGLSTLEAAALGCNVVITDRGYTRDYFGDDAWYCEPEDPASIRSAITAAYEAPYNEAFRKRILEQYTWDRAAEETLKAYEFVLQQAAGKP